MALAVALEIISFVSECPRREVGLREGGGMVPLGIYEKGKCMSKKDNEKPKLVKAR